MHLKHKQTAGCQTMAAQNFTNLL